MLGGGLLIGSPNYRWDANKGDSPYGADFLQDWTGANMIVSGQGSQLFDPPTFRPLAARPAAYRLYLEH